MIGLLDRRTEIQGIFQGMDGQAAAYPFGFHSLCEVPPRRARQRRRVVAANGRRRVWRWLRPPTSTVFGTDMMPTIITIFIRGLVLQRQHLGLLREIAGSHDTAAAAVSLIISQPGGSSGVGFCRSSGLVLFRTSPLEQPSCGKCAFATREVLVRVLVVSLWLVLLLLLLGRQVTSRGGLGEIGNCALATKLMGRRRRVVSSRHGKGREEGRATATE